MDFFFISAFRVRKFNEKQARFYAAQVFMGLEYLHKMHLLYRDLKPENVLIDATGYIKITDLGFVKVSLVNQFTAIKHPFFLSLFTDSVWKPAHLPCVAHLSIWHLKSYNRNPTALALIGGRLVYWFMNSLLEVHPSHPIIVMSSSCIRKYVKENLKCPPILVPLSRT